MPRIDDGFSTTIEFTDTDPNEPVRIIWEKRVKPPGMIGGGANDTTTMRNIRWRTKNSRSLLDLSEMSCTVAYDPLVYTNLLLALQKNQILIVNWPLGQQLTFWGFLDEFNPNEVVEGAQPEAEIKVIPSNQDADGEEVAPEFVDVV